MAAISRVFVLRRVLDTQYPIGSPRPAKLHLIRQLPPGRIGVYMCMDRGTVPGGGIAPPSVTILPSPVMQPWDAVGGIVDISRGVSILSATSDRPGLSGPIRKP